MAVTDILNKIERAGNRLPPPAILFLYLCFAMLVLSLIASLFGLSAVHPVNGETISAKNLVSQDGLHYILKNTVSNFVGFAPVGTVLVAILGIGVAERSGLIDALLKASVRKAPPQFLSFIVVLAGVMSNIAVDSGYVVLIPLAAIVFKSAGRPPLAGIAAAFAGVAGGFSANLLIGPLDTILAGISTEAAQLVEADYEVSVAANYYFMLASTLLVAVIGTWITEKYVSPMLESDQQEKSLEDSEENTPASQDLTAEQKRGLNWVGLFSLLFTLVILAGLLPEQGLLRDPATGSILKSPFIYGIVTIIAVYAAACGYIYGKISGSFPDNRAFNQSMDTTMETMGSYLVLMFFAAQFVNYFAWSQLGTIIAIGGANFLQTLQVPTSLLLILFVFISAFINLFIGSASAKWALLAPVFVPMLLLLGISPEATQVAYRIGDSSTNIITPLMPYFGVIVAFAQKYDKRCGIGTIVSMMLPYSIALLIGWSVLLLGWYWLDIPLGPGAGF